MSKRALSDPVSSEEDEDGLFSFSNKIELTFDKSKLSKKDIMNQNKKMKLIQADEDSSSSEDDSDYGEDDDEEDDEEESSQELVVIESKKATTKPPPNKTNAALERLKRFDVDLDASLTPPPKVTVTRRPIQSATYRNVKSTLDMLQKDFSQGESVLDIPDEIDIDEPKPMRLKIKLHGCIAKFDVLTNEPFRKVYNMIAANEKVDISKICMNFPQENPIKYDDTPEKLGITVADIIDCYIYRGDTIYEDGEDRISIKIQGRGKKSTKEYQVGKTEKLERILKEYSKFQNIKLAELNFFFDGDLISCESTPHDLDMDDGDVIDANS